MKNHLICLLLSISFCACGSQNCWTEEEMSLILDSPAVMRVLSVDEYEDSLVLRKASTFIPEEELEGEILKILSGKMLATVTSPEQDGVGIAAPQVGISRRIVAVQRFDKPGEPFEVYPNIRIVAFRGDTADGPEGCLSVPGRSGTVSRYRDIDITYSLTGNPAKDTTETVKGFTAVIFQHECDHLDGILYTDRLQK